MYSVYNFSHKMEHFSWSEFFFIILYFNGERGGGIYEIFPLLSGSAYKITVRESDPIIWYKPVEESVRGGSYLDRLVQAVSSVLQVWWSMFCMLQLLMFNITLDTKFGMQYGTPCYEGI